MSQKRQVISHPVGEVYYHGVERAFHKKVRKTFFCFTVSKWFENAWNTRLESKKQEVRIDCRNQEANEGGGIQTSLQAGKSLEESSESGVNTFFAVPLAPQSVKGETAPGAFSLAKRYSAKSQYMYRGFQQSNWKAAMVFVCLKQHFKKLR